MRCRHFLCDKLSRNVTVNIAFSLLTILYDFLYEEAKLIMLRIVKKNCTKKGSHLDIYFAAFTKIERSQKNHLFIGKNKINIFCLMSVVH